MWAHTNVYVKIQHNYILTNNMLIPYHEETKGISNSFHEKFILSEVFLIDIEPFWIEDVAEQEKQDEECDDYIDTSELKNAYKHTKGKGDQLTAPENQVQLLVLNLNGLS